MAIKTVKTTTAKPRKEGSSSFQSLKKKSASAAPGVAPKKPVLIPKQFDQTQIKRSCKALLAHSHKTFLSTQRRQQRNEEEDQEEVWENAGEPIYLFINTFEPVTSQKEDLTLIPVPNKVRPRLSKLQVCLIVSNPQKAVDEALRGDEKLPTYEMFADIISTSRLRSTLSKAKDVHQHKAAADWVKDFDIIVSDAKLKPQSLKSILGPRVYNKSASNKIQSPLPITLQPVPGPTATPVEIAAAQSVVADPETVKRQLKYISNCVVVQPSPGTSLSVLVGLSSFTKEQLIENITAAIKVILNDKKPLVADGWANVRNMHIKTNESAGLPLYNSPNSGLETQE